MDNKKRSDSFHRRQEDNSKKVWDQIKKFILEICQKNADQINAFKEEEQVKTPSKFAKNRSPIRQKDYFIVKSFLKEKFQDLAKQLGFDLNQQILQSFSNQESDESNEDKNLEEMKLRKQYLYNQMVHLGTNITNIHFSADSRFVLKGIPQSQFNTFIQSLQDACFQNIYPKVGSLSLRILGLFEIQNEDSWDSTLDLPSNYFILMENILADWNFDQNIIHSIYDLKGSNVGRSYDHSQSSSDSDDDKYSKSKNNALQNNLNNPFDVNFGKDNNLRSNQNDKDILISLPDNIKLEIIKQMKEECDQYSQKNIMDYSLMVVIGEINQKVQKQAQKNQKPQSKFRNIEINNYIISFGIIDYLSQYDFKKSLENTFKSIFCSNDDQISCIEPVPYFERIIKYVSNDVFAVKTN